MESLRAAKTLSAGSIARFTRVKLGATALIVAIVSVLASAQLVVAQCPEYQHGFSYNAVVPCQNATCAYFAYAVPSRDRANSGTPSCIKPSAFTIVKVSIHITKTSWSHCTAASSTSYPACDESPSSCANYWMYGDTGCTVLCQTADDLPTYCGYQQ